MAAERETIFSPHAGTPDGSAEVGHTGGDAPAPAEGALAQRHLPAIAPREPAEATCVTSSPRP